ncbi:hypothetical protein HGM15179_016537 [Zosterops borbonicus]|uniref:Uncharacterized protein n=1 Tax=Zosterops borbonicus TaxID=364589 RepID=A0A8K1G2X3_9PASS|nr:hypothetical protein HGM15179_016537 [Zosterops borbonicus]
MVTIGLRGGRQSIYSAMMEGVHCSWCPLTHKTHDEGDGNYLYQIILTNASEELKEILHSTTDSMSPEI